MEKGNILLIGNSGVGKSTLINAVFDNEEAYTSKGTEGTTKEIKVYPENDSDNELPFRLVDTMGFEASFFKIKKAQKQVNKWTKEGTKENGEDHRINLIWFCIDGTSGKLFPEYIKNMLKATSIWKTVPIVVVITKSYSKPEREENIALVRSAFNERSKDNERLKDVIPVVAKEYVIDEEQGIISPPDGIDKLIEVSNKLLPEGMKAAEAAIEAFILKRKRIFAHSLASTCTITAGAVGAVPIPVADAAILAPLEAGLLNGIAKIYEIKSDEDANLFKKTIIETGTVSVAAKALISAIKAIPGVNIGAAVLNSIIAGAIVASIGEVSIYAYEQVYLGKKTLKDIDWIKKAVEKALSSVKILKEIEKILKKHGKDSKKIIKEIITARRKVI